MTLNFAHQIFEEQGKVDVRWYCFHFNNVQRDRNNTFNLEFLEFLSWLQKRFRDHYDTKVISMIIK